MDNITVMSIRGNENIQEIDLNSSFNNIYERAEDIQENCYDYLIKGSDLTFYAPSMESPFNTLEIPVNNGYVNQKLSSFALSQLGNKLEVPGKYIWKCLDTGSYSLLNENINYWLSSYNKKVLIRNNKDRIRGILSKKYTSFDAPEILSSISNTINLNNYKVKGSYIDDERLHLRLVGNNNLNINGEDDLFPALFIDSSDVGRCALRVVFGIYKQVCTNGLIVKRFGGTIFSQKHMGINKEDLEETLVASVSRTDNLIHSSERMINEAKRVNFNYTSEEFSEWLKDSTRLSNTIITKTIGLMDSRYGSSKWGLINAITEVAQDYNLEQRIEMEELAGNMLTAA